VPEIATGTAEAAAPRRRLRRRGGGAAAERTGVWYPKWYWPSFVTPGAIWLAIFFVLPFYVEIGRAHV